MLNIFFKEDNLDIPEEKIIRDVEREFEKIKLTGSEIEKILLEKIEEARYESEIAFIDRFGFKLYTSELSTGCKAALCVLYNQDKIVDLIECGLNARDAIIAYIPAGNILIRDNGVTIQSVDVTNDISVKTNEFEFSSIRELNRYIFDERPFRFI